MTTLGRSISLILCLVSSVLFGQIPDLSSMTLDFVDVSSERLNSMNEDFDSNEKNVAFGDYDNDGDLDVAIANAHSDFGQRRNKLYRNDKGILNEVSGTSVIEGFSFIDVGRSIHFADFDKDGWLDLLVVCDANSGSSNNNAPGKTKYFRNVNGEFFVNDSDRLNGLVGAASLGTVADFDGNGYLDIVLCNHPNQTQNKISFNKINGNGSGEFEDLTNTHIPAHNEYGTHVEHADMNGDGKIDLLMASHASDDSYIYYNDNDGAGTELGDFRYTSPGSETLMPSTTGGIRERAMIPGDFNNDGLMDFYFANEGGFGAQFSDAIYVNVGNDENNKAIFQPQPISSDLNNETMKVTIKDLDQDGREDLIVMADFRRPYIYRNVSENGDVDFLEWTPANLSIEHQGWHTNAGNLTGDSRPDLFIGAEVDDFVFEGRTSQGFTVDELAGGAVLPLFHATQPIAITGAVEFGTTTTLVSLDSDLPPGAQVSVLLRSLGDLSLSVKVNGLEIASSNRAGYRVDEYLHFTVPGGNLVFEISAEALSFDANLDGEVNLLDVVPFVDCLTGVSQDCEPFDVNDDGDVNLLLVQPFVESVTASRNSEEFVIEFLSRSN